MEINVAAAEEADTCEDCPLANAPYVIGLGHSDCPFMVVGTAPGAVEEVSGIAFSGKLGTLVRSLLEDMQLDGESLYFTNVLKRRPEENRMPTKRECWKCGSHLMHEIVRNRPRAVLALGAVAMDFLVGHKLSLPHHHGLPLPVRRYALDFKVVPTFDPGYVQRSGGLHGEIAHEWLLDLEEFARIVRGRNR